MNVLPMIQKRHYYLKSASLKFVSLKMSDV